MALFTSPVLQSLISVAVPFGIMVVVAYSGLYDTLKVETGFEHYAEPADSKLGPIPFPSLIKMPANTLVNIGYMLVAVYWGVYTFLSNSKLNAVQDIDAYLLYVMVWIMLFYGPVQLTRIISQSREWAILDQWVTLPGFAWVLVMSQTMQTGWQARQTVLTMLASILSYNLVFTSEWGFEIALLPHIVYAVSSCWGVCNKFKPPNYRRTFTLGFLMCSGFVLLKVADFHLAEYAPFKELTGHFWSKICDFLQVHFVLQIFFNISLVRGARNLAKKLF